MEQPHPSYPSLQVRHYSPKCLKKDKPSPVLTDPEALQIQIQLGLHLWFSLALILLSIKWLPHPQESYPHFQLPEAETKVEQRFLSYNLSFKLKCFKVKECNVSNFTRTIHINHHCLRKTWILIREKGISQKSWDLEGIPLSEHVATPIGFC